MNYVSGTNTLESPREIPVTLYACTCCSSASVSLVAFQTDLCETWNYYKFILHFCLVWVFQWNASNIQHWLIQIQLHGDLSLLMSYKPETPVQYCQSSKECHKVQPKWVCEGQQQYIYGSKLLRVNILCQYGECLNLNIFIPSMF